MVRGRVSFGVTVRLGVSVRVTVRLELGLLLG